MTQVGLEFIARDRSRAGINSFRGNISTTTRTVQSLGRSLLAVAGVGGGLYMLSNVLRSGVTEAAAFEKQMANVSTMLSDQSMSLMPRYNQQVREMSKQFGEGTETLAKGLYDILSASIAPAQALDVLAVSARAAKAGITDTGIAADAITTILNSYSLDASRAADVSDKLFGIVIKGKTTFAELAPNIGKVAALAATAGESFDDLGAVIATMTRAGVQTEIAITSLRAIILSFLKPQSDSIEMARKYGVELNSTTLRTIGLTGVIEKLKKATAEELAVIVPTSRAITGFAAAIQKSEGLASDYEFILGSLGSTETAYQKIAATSAFQLDQMNQQYIDLKRTVGNEVIPVLIDLLKHMNAAAEGGRFHALIHENIAVLYEFADAMTNLDELFKMAGAKGWDKTYKELAAEQRQLAADARAVIAPPEPAGGIVDWSGDSWKANQRPGAEIRSPDRTAGVEDAAINALTIEQQKAANERAKITAKMYSDMGQLGSGYFEAQKTLLDNQKVEYGKFVDDKVLLERWYSGELIKLQEDTAEQSVNLWDRAMAEREKIWRNGLSKIAAAEREQMDIMMRMQDETKSKWVSMWDPVIDGSMTATEAVKSFFVDFLIRLAQAKMQMMMLNLWNAGVGGIFGGVSGAVLGAGMGGALTGGGSMVTAGGNSAYSAKPYPVHHSGWVPDGVPRFRTGRGLGSNEMAAIIEKDEMLVPADKVVRSSFSRSGSTAPSINIYNESGRQIEQKGQPEFDGEKWVVSLVAKNISEGGSLSKLMKR